MQSAIDLDPYLMPLRIYFEKEDLGRTRLADGPQLMWELLFSLHRLRDSEGTFVFDSWRHQVRRHLTEPMRWLLRLAWTDGFLADLFAPLMRHSGANGALDEGLENLLANGRVRAEPSPAIDGAHIATMLREYHRLALAPHWREIERQINADLTVRVHALGRAGVLHLLAGLHPSVRWAYPVLQVAHSLDRELHLCGRGLLLLPSFFCWPHPIARNDPGLNTILVFPITHDLDWSSPRRVPETTGSLEALIGRTRAAILTALADRPHSTGQLAKRIGRSLASASQQATILRDGGLITTRRRGSAVIHTITTLGANLLDRSRSE